MIANYCLIKQNLASLVADSSDDSDRYPDVAQISGQVTFTPTTPQGQTYKIKGEDGELYTVPVTAITARIEDGKIVHEGKEGVYVFAGGEASNPKRVVYRASYSGLRSGSRGGVISLNAVTFEAIPGGEIDLTTVTPVSGTPAPGIVKGDPFLYEDFTPEQLEALRGPQGEPGPLTFADFTPEQIEIIRGPQGDKGDKGDKGDQGIPGDVTQLRGEITAGIAALVDGAPEDLNTLREIAAYAEANRGITDQLNAAIGGKADKVHTHEQDDITGLSTALDSKADKAHTHETSQVVGLDNALSDKADKAHTHAQEEITGLSTALSNKANKTHSHDIGDVNGLMARFGGGNVSAPTAAGDNSVAVGPGASAAGSYSTALGNGAEAEGQWSAALGNGASAVGSAGFALGPSATAGGDFSLALGNAASSAGSRSSAVGNMASATGDYSQALTALSTATKNRHTVIGINATDENIPTDVQGTVVIGIPGAPVYLAGRDVLAEVEGLEDALAGKAAKSHAHTTADITDFTTEMDNKADKSHTHSQSDITGLSAEFDKKADSSHKHTTADITNFATEMGKKADTSHTHSQSDITGLSTALSGKADSTHTHTQGEVTGLATALNGKADKTHTHTASQISGLGTALNGKADKSYVDSRPALFSGVGAPPSSIPGAVAGDFWLDESTKELHKITGV